MGDAKQLRRNFLWNTFGQIVYMVCHFLFGILILSLAGAEQSGIFTTAVSATGIFLSIASYGMYNFQVSDAHEKYAQSCYIRSRAYTVALAIACSHSGHPLVLCVPGSIGPARQKLLTELGAKLAFTTGGRTGAAARAQAVAMRTGGYFLNYFDNDINAEFHRRVTGPAIVKATGGELDAIVVGVGSGGTITGVGEYVKAWYPDVRIIAVEPAESQALAGGVVGRHSIPGIGAGFVPENYNPYIVDGVVAVPSARAGVLAQEVLRTDAVPAAPSAGAVLCAMHSLVQKEPSIRRVLGVFSGAQAVE